MLIVSRASSSPITWTKYAETGAPILFIANGRFDVAAKALGHEPCDPAARRGLHPLIEPLAQTSSGDVLGLMRWPLQDGTVHIVQTRSQDNVPGGDESLRIRALTVRPCGSVAQFARRAAAEADNGPLPQRAGIIAAAGEATLAASGKPYTAGELAESRLRLPQFLLMSWTVRGRMGGPCLEPA